MAISVRPSDRHFSDLLSRALRHLHLSGSNLLSLTTLSEFLGGRGKMEPKMLRLVIRLT